MDTPTTEIIDMDAPNTVAVTRDLQNELAATASAWFARRQEKNKANATFNEELGELEERMDSLIYEIKSGGVQLVMHFGTTEEGEPYDPLAALDETINEGDDELEEIEEATGTEGDDELDKEFVDEETEH